MTRGNESLFFLSYIIQVTLRNDDAQGKRTSRLAAWSVNPAIAALDPAALSRHPRSREWTFFDILYDNAIVGKVHGSLARAGKVRGQTPKVAPQEKAKKPTGRACKRVKYNRRFVNVVTGFGKKRGPNSQ